MMIDDLAKNIPELHRAAKEKWGDKPAPFKIWQEENIGQPDYRTVERTIAYMENWRVKLLEMVLKESVDE
jgi:hypothetical protein